MRLSRATLCPHYPALTGASVAKIKRLLAIISKSVPFKPDNADKGDFVVNDAVFEVGGKGKGFSQVKDAKKTAVETRRRIETFVFCVGRALA